MAQIETDKKVLSFHRLRFMLDTSCILWILPTGQVSNNSNLLEVFFCVNLLAYLKYTGSFLELISLL